MKFPDFQILVINLSISISVNLKQDQAGDGGAGSGLPELEAERTPVCVQGHQLRGPLPGLLVPAVNLAKALWRGMQWLLRGASLSPQALLPDAEGPCLWAVCLAARLRGQSLWAWGPLPGGY